MNSDHKSDFHIWGDPTKSQKKIINSSQLFNQFCNFRILKEMYQSSLQLSSIPTKVMTSYPTIYKYIYTHSYKCIYRFDLHNYQIYTFFISFPIQIIVKYDIDIDNNNNTDRVHIGKTKIIVKISRTYKCSTKCRRTKIRKK